jgi:hypothetical protein
VVGSSLRTVGVLLLLLLALPFTLALTGVALIVASVTASARRPAPSGRTVLISGGKMTKALQLCRSFHAAGHRVVLVESAKYRLTGHRFSRAVDAFFVVPKPQDPGYAAALREIVHVELVDLYVPVCSPVASWYDALAADQLGCEVLHLEPEMVAALDDKHAFTELAASLGLSVPDTHRITSPSQVEEFDFAGATTPYVLKSIAYDPVNRLDLTQLPLGSAAATAAFASSKPISEANPWILQEYVTGQEWCTHSTAREGRVQVYCCCPSSAFQINYEMVDKPAIDAWVHRFIGALGLTGQVSFDFLESADGQVYAIECNPRTHSAITLFGGDRELAAAYLEPGHPELRPPPGSRPTYWIYHELWRLLTHPSRERIRIIRNGRDAIFDWHDPLPFLLVHHLQIPLLLVSNLRRGKGWIRIDFNIGKLVEAAGD